MCEAVERYGYQMAIKATIETGIRYGASREQIIEDICKQYSMAKEVAEQIYERFVPAVV